MNVNADFEYSKYVNDLCKQLFDKEKLTVNKFSKYIVFKYYYGGLVNGYIPFGNEKELRSNKFFKMFYNKLSKKYKSLICTYIDSFSYRANNRNRGYRGKVKYFNIAVLQNFYAYSELDLDIFDVFEKDSYFQHNVNSAISEFIACELVENKEFLNYFKAMVYDNENIKNLSVDLIKGAIVSNNSEAVQAVFDLLKAAKLSEGLRSSIVNFIDYGSIETYKLFLTYIRDENLSRFSSTKHAFGLFTGVSNDSGDYQKRAQYVMDCILDNRTGEYLESDNALKVYVGLYALSVYDVQQAYDYIIENYKSAKGYRRACFIYFIVNAFEEVDSKIVTYCLENEENDEIRRIIFDVAHSVSFKTKVDKQQYVYAALDVINNLKTAKTYSLFDEGYNNMYSSARLYNEILQLVKELNNSELYELAYMEFGKYDIDAAILHSIESSSYNRIYSKFTYLDKIYHPAQRSAIIRGLSSSISSTRRNCYNLVNILKLEFLEEEFYELGMMLKSKRMDLRNNICNLFTKADASIVISVATHLINQNKDELKNGGLSILVDNLERIRDLEAFDEVKKLVEQNDFSHEVITLKEAILSQSVEIEEVEAIDLGITELKWDNKLVEKVSKYNLDLIIEYIERWYEMFTKHFDEEIFIYSSYDNSKEKVVVGKGLLAVSKCGGVGYGDEDIDVNELKTYQKYPYYEEYIKELGDLEVVDVAMLLYIKGLIKMYFYAVSSCDTRWYTKYQQNDIKRFEFYIKENIIPDLSKLKPYIQTIKFSNFSEIVDMIVSYMEIEKNIKVSNNEEHCRIMLNHLAYTTDYWVNKQSKIPTSFIDFTEGDSKIPWFVSDNVLTNMVYFDNNYAYDILRALIKVYGEDSSPVDELTYFYFIKAGLISKEYLIARLLNPNFKDRRIHLLNSISRVQYFSRKDKVVWYEKYLPYHSDMKEVYNEVVDIMLETEFQRTDKETKYTGILRSLQVFYGVEIFARCLDKVNKIDFVRNGSYSDSKGIKGIFSSIISKTQQEDNLTYEEFKAVINKYTISDKKLLEAALYNRYFTNMCSKYLDIDGLEKALYYFRAHSLDNVRDASKEEVVIIKRYSDFELEDFVDGKFDIKWFKEIQSEMSEEDYKNVYDASRFIMGTSKRKRGQYFSDAVLGNLSIDDVEDKINDKRNQDMLLCYGLLPLDDDGNRESETLRRYKRIQLFLKESKQFGAQRRATEARRVNIAISNLATNYGLDVDRFTWTMETNLIDEIRDVFEEREVGDIKVHLSLDNVQNPEIIVYKDNKKLKSVPAKYKKDEFVKRIIEVKNEIKSQYSRARTTLENAMINSDMFSLSELDLINAHPVVSKIMQKVLLIEKDFIGFFANNQLVNYSGEIRELNDDSKLRIAHCVDFVDNEWNEWQNYIMKNNLVQPFKQVFRELYNLTSDEMDNDGYTNRFAGYQIEARKALGVLSNRGWLINEELGFEKVNHAHNLRIDLYCYADWRNANYLEEETLEKVTFINNKTNKTMDMKQLDKVLFSETMRDLDLVVSVAYVGGVDPLLNHTTIEMRKRILEHNMELFKIDNYVIKEKHILIDGKLGKYSIHLGSGIINVEGRGMLPMTPVHSQKRGRIFLPFVDDDPKTAEIITKTMMLAKDDKINDPTILQYLR